MSVSAAIARLALLPGIVLHELAHYYFCRLIGTPVEEVSFFSFGSPAGYVTHRVPKRFRGHTLIVFGPLLVNSIVAVVLYASAILTWREIASLPPIDWAPRLPLLAGGAWLAIVTGLQALPSNGDAISLWRAAKWHRDNGNFLALLAFPLALAIRLANWLRGFWIDWIYSGILFAIALDLSTR
ncbi:MAG: DUF3267 domain-containing protein [Chloroflexota bacterium]|nr:MAG: DUF3267 domain-containing protein [Chloroflexota bacterium]